MTLDSDTTTPTSPEPVAPPASPELIDPSLESELTPEPEPKPLPPPPEAPAPAPAPAPPRAPHPILKHFDPMRAYTGAILILALAFAAIALYNHWVPNKWLFGDGSFYMNVSRGLLENGSFRQEGMHPHSWYEQDLGWNQNIDAAWSNIALGPKNQWWPKHPILLPIVAAPFIWAFGSVGSLVFQVICFGLMALFAFRVAARVAPRPAALAAAAAFVATPWIFDRAWGFNNDVFYSVLILAALDAALGRRPTLSGLLVGIGIFAKATNVLYAPALFLLFLLRKPIHKAFRFALAAFIPAASYLFLNLYMFGSPFRTGYDRILIRENGLLGMHSHSADFHFNTLGQALPRVLLGSDGFLANTPIFVIAMLGFAVLAIRAWREALVLAWCIAVPVIFHAPYTWYRLEFNLPQLAMAVAPLAALLLPRARPAPEPENALWSRWHWKVPAILAASFLVLLGIGFGRQAIAARQGDYFWRELPHAKVFLGDYACDYYNNLMERWECSHHDQDAQMTGRVLGPSLRFNQLPRDLLLFSPHPSGKPRVLEYPNVMAGKTMVIRFGMADGTPTGKTVHLEAAINGTQIFSEEVAERGLQERTIDTSLSEGQKVTIRFTVTSPEPGGVVFGLGGDVR